MKKQKLFSKCSSYVFKSFIYIAFFLGGFLGVSAQTVTLDISPNTKSAEVGEYVQAKINILNPKGVAVNVVGATLNFPADLLTLTNVSKDGSVIMLWTDEPIIGTGVLKFSGGSTQAITSSTARVLTLMFKVKSAGNANLAFENSKVLLADGKGTDALGASTKALWTFTLPKPKPIEAIKDRSTSVTKTNSISTLSTTTINATSSLASREEKNNEPSGFSDNWILIAISTTNLLLFALVLLHFWEERRKVVVDAPAQTPPEVGA